MITQIHIQFLDLSHAKDPPNLFVFLSLSRVRSADTTHWLSAALDTFFSSREAEVCLHDGWKLVFCTCGLCTIARVFVCPQRAAVYRRKRGARITAAEVAPNGCLVDRWASESRTRLMFLQTKPIAEF